MNSAMAVNKTLKTALDVTATAFAPTISEMPEKLSTLLRDGDVLITMGAGSISGLPHVLAEVKNA
jgi:UDP-N-acetylmuramate--alanine ligase